MNIPNFESDDKPIKRRKRKFDTITKEKTDHRQPGKIQIVYSDKYPQILKAFSNGKTVVEIAATIFKCSKEWFYQLCKKDSELAEIVEQGKSLSELWWIEKGRKNLDTRGFNSHLYQFMMSNIHKGWQTNKTTVEAHIEATVDTPLLSKITDAAIDKLLENS